MHLSKIFGLSIFPVFRPYRSFDGRKSSKNYTYIRRLKIWHIIFNSLFWNFLPTCAGWVEVKSHIRPRCWPKSEVFHHEKLTIYSAIETEECDLRLLTDATAHFSRLLTSSNDNIRLLTSTMRIALKYHPTLADHYLQNNNCFKVSSNFSRLLTSTMTIALRDCPTLADC